MIFLFCFRRIGFEGKGNLVQPSTINFVVTNQVVAAKKYEELLLRRKLVIKFKGKKDCSLV